MMLVCQMVAPNRADCFPERNLAGDIHRTFAAYKDFFQVPRRYSPEIKTGSSRSLSPSVSNATAVAVGLLSRI
jgi:hypothetical protein